MSEQKEMECKEHKEHKGKKRHKEASDDNEKMLIKEIAEDTLTLLNRRYPEPAAILRGVHPKSHGCLSGSFVINQNIPESFQVGLFSEPGTRYEAVVRFSNATTLVGCDLAGGNGSRGMAVKVMNVTGQVIEKGKEGKCQDFLMINTASFAFSNTEDYHRLTKILLANNDSPAEFFKPLQEEVPGISSEAKARIFKSSQVLKEIAGKPVANPLEVIYFGAAPFGFGADRVMRFSVHPRVAPEPQLPPDDPAPCDYLKDKLTARMTESEPVVFDFKVQVRDAANITDMEDATSFWSEEETRSVTVATLTLNAPQAEVSSASQRNACEKLVFTPWQALVEHKPLGSINRLRKKVYEASSDHRCPARGAKTAV